MRKDNKITEATPAQSLKDNLDQDEGALSRWSRRKQQALEQSEKVLPAAPVVDEAETETEQPVLTDADMPPVENLSEDSDYSGFLSPGVSEELRALALRKLFRSAKFNIVDGLDDYDDDFRAVTLLKDVLMADATDKLNEATNQAPEDEEPTQAKRESIGDEQEASEDAAEDKTEVTHAESAETKNEQDNENNDEATNNGESGAA
ncbi:MAG: DUF3306 domain-containing protein [Gammaproteobacteria bacterium]|nr:DUF3306 domain-containing protein [Gammaproteobacteria bacterium]